MKQNLFWATIYNVIASRDGDGDHVGILLAPEVGALAMSAHTITVATNAVLFRCIIIRKKL